MTLKQRKILFYVFCGLFIVIFFIAVTYASGYKVSTLWPFKMEKTGMFIIKTKPEGAKIYIDGKLKKNILNIFGEGYTKTPAKIKGLLPDEYNITLELDGYWSWEKKMEIKPGQSNIIDNIFFRKDIPIKISDYQEGQIKYSPNKKYCFNLNQLINLKTDEVLKFEFLSQEAKNVSWSSDSKKILIDNFVYNLENKKETNLKATAQNSLSNIKWANNSYSIYYQDGNSIHLFNLDSGQDKVIAQGEKYLDYEVFNDNLVYISEINRNTKLKSLNLSNNLINYEMEMPFSPGYTLVEGGQYLNVLDTKYNILYIIELYSQSPVKEVLTNVQNFYWINQDNLLYNTNFEIWTLDLNLRKKDLLTRIGKPITSLAWHYSNKYLIYSTAKIFLTPKLNMWYKYIRSYRQSKKKLY